MKSIAIRLGLVAALASPTLMAGQQVGHDDMQPFSTPVHDWIWNARPHFSYHHGCYAYPAVDQQGNWGGGLRTTGAPDGSCDNASFLQTYTRAEWITDNSFPGAAMAIMYAQYMPKDQGKRWIGWGGHRHEWEEVVVFVDGNGYAIKAAASYHGDYQKMSRSNGQYWDGNRIKIWYGTQSYFRNNSFHFSTGTGVSPPMVDWHDMDSSYRQRVRDAITHTNWGGPTAKLTDGRFWDKVREAW